MYINPDIKEKYRNRGYSLNREFEMSMSDNYNYICSKDTEMYMKLSKVGLVKTI